MDPIDHLPFPFHIVQNTILSTVTHFSYSTDIIKFNGLCSGALLQDEFQA